MPRFRVSSLVFGVVLLLAGSLFAQQPSSEPLGKHPDVAANPGVDNMYVPPIAGQPFSGRSVVTVSRSGSATHVMFISMLARDSKGKLYFENRRPVDETGQPRPRWYFIVIDPQEKTRTICYTSTKTCRINSFRRISFGESDDVDAPRASTMETISLGSSVIDALAVDGRRETTSVAAGVYGNPQPLVITREIWHSPELNLDISITKTDPRSGVQTRKIEIVSRGEPDADYFTIPSDYTQFKNTRGTKRAPEAQ